MAFKTGDSKSEYNVPRKAHSISTIDYDLDGDIDILIGHLTAWQQPNPTFTIMENNNGTFQIYDTSQNFCGYQENIFAYRINADTFPDLVCFYSDFSSGSAERFVRIYYNENGEFSSYENFNLNSSETFITINYGDFNGDGFIDLVVASNLGQFWGVLYNDGTGSFSTPQYHDVDDYYPTDIACADLNDDGRDDIVIGGKTEIFFSNETGFQSLYFNTITNDIKTVDFDNDGDIDIIGAHQPLPSNYYRITFIENLGNENFNILPFYTFQPVCFGLAVSDFNNDSLPDILLHTQDMQHLLIFNNKGFFELSEPHLIPMADYGESNRSSDCADFDGNGHNDIATIRSWGVPLPANLNILFNDGNGNFVENPITNIPTPNSELQTPNLTCYPNPMKNGTNFNIEIKETASVELTIYNLQGKPINNLVNKKLEGGIHKIKWDGFDNGDKPCKPGSMVAYLKVNGEVRKSIKLIKLK
jgi:hypothetical protein